jgi:hypothetical protein
VHYHGECRRSAYVITTASCSSILNEAACLIKVLPPSIKNLTQPLLELFVRTVGWLSLYPEPPSYRHPTNFLSLAAMVVFFGSLGDILAIAQLEFNLAKTLSASRGSSAEYQELISELHSLSSALEGLHRQLSDQPPNRLHLDYSTENAIKFSLEKCRTLMNDFHERVKGYEKALQKGGSGSKMRDSWRKIGWGIFKREDVVDLKNKLMEQKTTINLMLSFSNW